MNKRMKSLGVVIILLLTLISFTPSAASTYWIKNLTSSNLYNNLQLAINDASPGDTLQIYAGSHLDSNKTIWINKTLTITGNSTSSTKYSLGGNNTRIVIENDSINFNNITIENIYFDIHKNSIVIDNTTILNGSYWYDGENTSTIYCLFYDSGKSGHTISNSTIKNTNIFINSSFGFAHLYAYPILSLSSINKITINNCYINGSSEFTFDEFYIYFNSPISNSIVANTIAYFAVYGLYIEGSNVTIFNNTFKNFCIDETLDYDDYGAIGISPGTNNVTIENNTFKDFYLAFDIYEDCINISIRNNTVTNAIYAFMRSSSDEVKFNNVVIVNNYFDVSYDVVPSLPLTSSNITWNLTKKAGTNIVGGSYLGGNYWSCYLGEDTDGDGIGDTYTPYTGYGNEIGGDYLPLTIEKPTVYVQEDRDISWYDGTHLNSIWNGTLAVSENGTVNIFSGEYIFNDDFDLNKSITFHGNNSNVTILNSSANAVYVWVDNVNIDNIRFNWTDMAVVSSDNVNISNCFFYEGEIGFYDTDASSLYNCENNGGDCSNGIQIIASTDSTVEKCYIYSFDNPIYILYSENITINKNVIENFTECGILIESDDGEVVAPTCYNIIMNNTIIGQEPGGGEEGGIVLDYFDIWSDNSYIHHTHIFYNTIYNCMEGIFIAGYNSTVNSNYIEYNHMAIEVSGVDNLFFNNYISDNTYDAYDYGYNNKWNITKTLGENIIGGPFMCGNYWHQYTGVDADKDGIGDTPYGFHYPSPR